MPIFVCMVFNFKNELNKNSENDKTVKTRLLMFTENYVGVTFFTVKMNLINKIFSINFRMLNYAKKVFNKKET